MSIINRNCDHSLALDMNFMFPWLEQYFTRSLRSLVRYCFCHSNIKFISSRHLVISSTFVIALVISWYHVISYISYQPPVSLSLLIFLVFREEVTGEGSPFQGSARLCFSLSYDKFSEELKVCLIRATRLTPIGENVTVTPYVKIFLLPDKKRKAQSRVLRRTSNPQFHEDFVFMVSPVDLPNRTLEFTVCEFDRFSRQQVIGHVRYPLRDVNDLNSVQGTGEIWVDINNEDLKVCECWHRTDWAHNASTNFKFQNPHLRYHPHPRGIWTFEDWFIHLPAPWAQIVFLRPTQVPDLTINFFLWK